MVRDMDERSMRECDAFSIPRSDFIPKSTTISLLLVTPVSAATWQNTAILNLCLLGEAAILNIPSCFVMPILMGHGKLLRIWDELSGTTMPILDDYGHVQAA